MTNKFAQKVIDVIQTLEDIGGPDTVEQYIAVLTLVKLDIDRRIANASVHVPIDTLPSLRVDGFEVHHAGGGCTSLRKVIPELQGVRGQLEILITNAGGSMVPIHGQTLWIGVYDLDGAPVAQEDVVSPEHSQILKDYGIAVLYRYE